MKTICWVRRDLRLHDHAALSAALKEGEATVVFVFDIHILEKLSNKEDRRITFIMQSLHEMHEALTKKKSALVILYGRPEEEIPKYAQSLGATAVFCNRDYEPYAKKRDKAVSDELAKEGIEFFQYKDSVVYEGEQIRTGSGTVYKIFTPYKHNWLRHFEAQERLLPEYPCNLKNLDSSHRKSSFDEKALYKKIGFIECLPSLKGGTKAGQKQLNDFINIVDDYDHQRNYPALHGTSLLSVYIRHGNISIREMVSAVSELRSQGAKTWLSELIWREFYQMLLDAFPEIETDPFKPEYAKIKWVGKKEHFKAWCEGQTGFPIIDAAMRCLNETGKMHNRLRMITASFLCKILLYDWKAGEMYFAEKLLDYDLAANNGGWQWSSSSGADAQPYFRIFNPWSQSKNFDKDGEFIKEWCPELKDSEAKDLHSPLLNHKSYPAPIVDYKKNRERCLVMYSVVKDKKARKKS
jgi:deoxyribodipyrimidine photo-lyase